MRGYIIHMHRKPESGMYLVDEPDRPGIVTESANQTEGRLRP